MPPRLDLTDKIFDRWTVVSFAFIKLTSGGNPVTYWHCRCVCGTERAVVSGNLVKRLTHSCGCWNSEQARARGNGSTQNPLYHIWGSMIDRCENPHGESFQWYGARGITVCERWRRSFHTFADDMGVKPSPQHSLERLNNNGPYSPENCVWATAKQQGRNKRNNHFLTFQGKTQPMSAWAEETGISYFVLRSRIHNKWSDEDALTIPVGSIPRGSKPHVSVHRI